MTTGDHRMTSMGPNKSRKLDVLIPHLLIPHLPSYGDDDRLRRHRLEPIRALTSQSAVESLQIPFPSRTRHAADLDTCGATQGPQTRRPHAGARRADACRAEAWHVACACPGPTALG